MTLLGRTPKTERIFRPDFLYEIRLFLSGEEESLYYMDLFIKNILLFAPFGFLFPRKKGWKQVLIAGLIVSSMIELTQYVTLLGECELDDVISNTCGTACGYGMRVFADSLICRWRSADGTA